jgi:O-antigen/teichoic acid export membrane protein
MKKASLLVIISLFSLGGAFTPRPFSKKTIVQSTQILRSTGSPAEDEEVEEGNGMLRGGGITEKVDPLPTMTDYRKFALPCLGLWVMGPLLSLIDTAFVGLSGDSSLSATQVAALGPATTFFDGATYLFAFLNVASTNLYSSARAQHGEDSPKTESVVRTAARVSLMSGFVVMGLLFAFARPLLALYIGT